MDIVDLLNIIMIIAVFLIMVLGVIFVLILYKNQSKNQTKKETFNSNSKSAVKQSNPISDVRRESTFNFLEFDEVKDVE